MPKKEEIKVLQTAKKKLFPGILTGVADSVQFLNFIRCKYLI